MTTVEDIGVLVREARVLQRELATLDERVKAAKRDLQELLERRIPDAFAASDLAEFRTTDGKVVKVEPFVDCSIPVAMRNVAFAWLRDQGHSGIIKCEVSAMFGAGEVELAQRTAKVIRDTGIPCEVSESVHPQTLKAFARELLGQGGNLPESFSVYTGARATIK